MDWSHTYRREERDKIIEASIKRYNQTQNTIKQKKKMLKQLLVATEALHAHLRWRCYYGNVAAYDREGEQWTVGHPFFVDFKKGLTIRYVEEGTPRFLFDTGWWMGNMVLQMSKPSHFAQVHYMYERKKRKTN